jgi:coenzyme Q-binding protein COQ10
MTIVQRSITVNAAPETIEAYSRYAESWPDWFPGVVNVAVGDSYPEVGSAAQVDFQAAGITFELTFIVQDYVPGVRVEYEIQGMANGRASFDLAAEGGEQWVAAEIEYELPGGVLGQIADRAVVERRVESALEEALMNLKAGAEG